MSMRNRNIMMMWWYLRTLFNISRICEYKSPLRKARSNSLIQPKLRVCSNLLEEHEQIMRKLKKIKIVTESLCRKHAGNCIQNTFSILLSRHSVEDIHNMHANLNIIYGTTIKYFKAKVQNVVCLRVDCVKTHKVTSRCVYCNIV